MQDFKLLGSIILRIMRKPEGRMCQAWDSLLAAALPYLDSNPHLLQGIAFKAIGCILSLVG